MNALSLITPSGRLTLGNLLGALRPMAAAAGPSSYFGVADLHALTTPHSPALLRSRVAEMSTLLLACGLDAATLFVQSQVPAHRSLAYLLECVASTGELNRMIQFKEKGAISSRASLYTYPTLMAADILLYRTAEVPVGDDQRQHVELTRDLALRFNREYGEVFTVPRAVHPPCGARVMDLTAPGRKMSKSAGDDHSGTDLPPGPARSDPAQGDARGHRLRGGRSGRAGRPSTEARRHQPARHPAGVRRFGRGDLDVRGVEDDRRRRRRR